METIKKQTSAGEVEIQISWFGCVNARAFLGGKQIEGCMMPLKKSIAVNGKALVSTIGKLGLTAEDVAAIEAAGVRERAVTMESDEWKASLAENARDARRAEYLEQNAVRAQAMDRSDCDR